MFRGKAQDIAFESEQAMPFVILGEDGGGEGGRGGAELQRGARSDPFPRAKQRPPLPGLGFPEQQDLHGPTTSPFSTAEAGGDDFGVVENQEIARTQPVPEVGEGRVMPLAGLTFDDQQARGIPLWSRVLSDQLGGKVEVEIGDQHSGRRKAQDPVKGQSAVRRGTWAGVKEGESGLGPEWEKGEGGSDLKRESIGFPNDSKAAF